MEQKVVKEEVYPVYFEDKTDRTHVIRDEIEVDPRVWEDYKMARDKFLKLKGKILKADNKQTRQ